MLELELVIHTRLSSILETLAAAAVSEITSLIKEYSILLRLELSRERQDKEIRKNNVIESAHLTRLECGRAEHDRLLNNAAQIGTSPRQTPECGEPLESNEQAAATPEWTNALATGMEVGDKASLTGMKTEPQLVIKQEELEDDLDPELELRMKAPEHFNISPVTRQQPTEQQVFEEEWQFQSLSAEGKDELSESIEHNSDPGHTQSVVEQHHSISCSLEQHAGIQSESLRLGAELGLELHQGPLGVTYPDYVALSLGNNNTETPGSGPDLSYSPENQQTTTALDDPALLQRRYNSAITISGHQGHQRGSSGGRTSCQSTKEGRFVCKHCGKCFPYPSVLQRHVLIHTGERPHLCRMCGRSFIRKSHLRRHEKLHVKLLPRLPTQITVHNSSQGHLSSYTSRLKHNDEWC